MVLPSSVLVIAYDSSGWASDIVLPWKTFIEAQDSGILGRPTLYVHIENTDRFRAR